MKASDLVQTLLDEIRSFGDREIVFMCSCTEDEPIEIDPKIGWFEQKIFLQCPDCRHDAEFDKNFSEQEELRGGN